MGFDFEADSPDWLISVLHQASKVDAVSSETANDYNQKESLLKQFVTSIEYQRQKWQADLWCLAFAIEKNNESPLELTTQTLRKVAMKGIGVIAPSIQREWKQIIDDYQFFHWDLEFPEIFSKEKGGFDLIIGNPPWEKIKIQEVEWFAQRDPEIASIRRSSERKEKIDQLKQSGASLYSLFLKAQKIASGTSQLIRQSGLYPLCGQGDINTYPIFAELNTRLINRFGRIGCIVPSGIATDNTTKEFFQDIVEHRRLVSLYDFENRKRIFPIDSRMKFTLLTLAGEEDQGRKPQFSFFNYEVKDLEKKEKLFSLSTREIALLNPNTRNAAIFRTVQDAELTKAIYRRVPILLRQERPKEQISGSNPWKITCSTMFHMSNDSNLFHTQDQLEYRAQRVGNHYITDEGVEYYPLYESKMIHQFNHRFGDYNDLPEGSRSTQLPNIPEKRLKDPNYTVTPRYWVAESELRCKVPEETAFLMGFRDITNVTNERTVISSVIPVAGVGNTLFLYQSNLQDTPLTAVLSSILNSFILDYVARQKIGGTHLSFGILYQLPVLPPERFTPEIKAEILPMVLELVYTAEDLRPFAEALGYSGNPFVWDAERRFNLRCQLDAIYFGLYLGFDSWSKPQEGMETEEEYQSLTSFFPKPINALDYIMRTFPIVERHERADLQKIAWAGGEGEYYPSHAMIRKFFLERC